MMPTNAPIDPVSDAISQVTYLVEVARLAVLQLDIPKAKACLLEAAAILETAKKNKKIGKSLTK